MIVCIASLYCSSTTSFSCVLLRLLDCMDGGKSAIAEIMRSRCMLLGANGGSDIRQAKNS